MLKVEKMLRGAKEFVKVPVPVKAIQVNETFEIETAFGSIRGKSGDFLVENEKGQLNIVDKDFFFKVYQMVVIK